MYGKKKINLQSKEEVHSTITNIINEQFDNELEFKKGEIQQINDNLKIVGNLINAYQMHYDKQIQEVKSSPKTPFDPTNLFQVKQTPIFFQTAENEFVQLICKECDKKEFQSEVGFLAHMREVHNVNYTLEKAIESSSEPVNLSQLPGEIKTMIDNNKNEINNNDPSERFPRYYSLNSSQALSPSALSNSSPVDSNLQSPSSNPLKRKATRNSLEEKKIRKISDHDEPRNDSHNSDNNSEQSNINSEHNDDKKDVNNINNNNSNNNKNNRNNNGEIKIKEETLELSDEQRDKKREELERKKERWKERHSQFLLSKGIVLKPPKIIHTSDLLRPLKVETNLESFILKRIIIGNTSKFVPKKLRELDDDTTHKWMIYVRGPEDEPDLSHFVKKVRFFLHPSFAPNDVVDVIHSPFRIVRRGWGEFPVLIQIFFLTNIHPPVDYTHHLKLDKSCSGQPLLGSESAIELVFDPTFFCDIYKLQQQQISLTNSLLSQHKNDDDDD